MSLLPPLATPQALAALTGRSAADQMLVGALRSASARFRAAVHHPVSLVQDEELELDGTGSREIFLPAVPVVHIASLRLTNGGAELLPGRDYSVSKRAGILRRLGGRIWPDELGFAVLRWSHGYESTEVETPTGQAPMLVNVPDDIQAAVLEMAQVLINVTPGLQGMTVLGDNVQFGGAATVGITQNWADAVNGYLIANGDRA